MRPLTSSELTAVSASFAQGANYTLFSSPEWYQHLAQWGLERDNRLYFFTHSNSDGELPLILPMMVAPGSKAQLKSMTNYYSPIFEPIGGLCTTSQQVLLMIEGIKQQLPNIDRIQFEALVCGSTFYVQLKEALRQAGFQLFEGVHSVNWYQPCIGLSYTDYWRSRNGRMRNTLKRKKKLINQAGEVKVEIIDDGDQLEKWIGIYSQIYIKSWKQNEPYPHFIPDLIRLAARKGWLRLGVLTLDGAAIAVQLWFVSNRSASIYKLAYDPAFRQYSPGTILTAAMLERVMDHDDVDEIDFLTGDDAYKADWMDRQRDRMWLSGCNKKTIRGYLYAMKYRCRAWLKL